VLFRSATVVEPLTTREAVARDTPARRATCSRVGRLGVTSCMMPCPGALPGQRRKWNQSTLTYSCGWPLVNVRYTVWVPVTGVTLPGTCTQLVHPPVLAIAKLPIGGLVGLPIQIGRASCRERETS